MSDRPPGHEPDPAVPVEPDVDVPTLPTVLREGAALVRILTTARPAAFSLAVLGACLFVAAIVASSFVVGWLTDEVVTPVVRDGVAPGERLAVAAAVLLGVGLWKVTAITLRRAAAGRAQFGAQTDLRNRLVAHQLDRPFGWFGRQRVGDLLAVNETFTRESTGVMGPMPFATGALFLLVGATVAVTLVDPVLGLLVGLSMAVVVVVDLVAAWLTFTSFGRMVAAQEVVSRVGHESVDGAQTIRALGVEDAEVERFGAAVQRRVRAEIDVARRFSWMRAFIETLPPALSIPVVVVGALRVGDGDLTAGDVVTVGYLMSLLSWPMALIGFVMWDLAHAVTAWRRVAAVFADDEAVPSGDAALDGGAPLRLAARGVSFGFAEDERADRADRAAASRNGHRPRPDDASPPVLRDVDLDVAAGSTVALVGPTGSGKSTLAAVLAGLRHPTTGEVLLDGRPLPALAHASLRPAVAHVDQEAFLFGDTLRFNVDLARGMPQAELERAAAMAALDGVVADLPDGWDTVVGERGTTLSGGQRQRVALARALAGRPRLLVLDDATSAVDPTVEARILSALRSAGTTVLMVANRPASVALADEVAFLVDGRVVAVGPHRVLLRDVPAYADLLRSYELDAAERARATVAAADAGRRGNDPRDGRARDGHAHHDPARDGHAHHDPARDRHAHRERDGHPRDGAAPAGAGHVTAGSASTTTGRSDDASAP